MGVGAYPDIGKKAKDILGKEFSSEQKVTITSVTSSGVVFTTVGTKRDDAVATEVKTEFKDKNVKVEVKVNSKSELSGFVTVADVAPGLDLTLRGNVPDQKSGKLEGKYVTPYAHILTTIGLTPQPLLEASAAVGEKGYFLGAEVAFDTAAGVPTKYNLAAAYTKDDFTGSVHVLDKLQTLKALLLHNVSPSAAVVAEVTYRYGKPQTAFTMGAQYKVDPLTAAKLRVTDRGSVAAFVQHEFRPKSYVGVTAEVDSKAAGAAPKYGLHLQLRP